MKVRIKDILESRNMTSKRLAELVGVSEQTISYTINGKVTPSVASLENIAKALKVPFWQLFTNPDEISEYAQHVHKDNLLTCPHCGRKIRISAEKDE